MASTKRMQVKDISSEGTVLAVIATLDVLDSDGDITVPGAFGEQVAQVVPAHDWSHVWLGKARVYESGNEALAEIKLNLDIEAAREWHSALKFDLAHGSRPLAEWSYGYTPAKFRHASIDGKHVRYLEQVTVHEVSPVMLGAGVGTRTIAAKSADGVCATCGQPLDVPKADDDPLLDEARRLYSAYTAIMSRR